jgi:hypothetical protein
VVLYKPNQLLIRTALLAFWLSCLGGSCVSRLGRDSRIESLLAVLSTEELNSGHPLLVIDVTSLQLADMDSAAIAELGNRIPASAALGIPSVNDVCSTRSPEICSGVWLKSYTDRGSTALIRALWGRVVPPGKCSGGSEATFEIDQSTTPHRVIAVRDLDHGSCGWEGPPATRDSIH